MKIVVAQKGIKGLTYLIVLASLTHVFFLWIGVKNSYSGVPFWDEWDSRYQFYTNFRETPLNALFQQHNEHRIVLTKLLFVIDFWIFNGSAAPLILVNLILSIVISIIVSRNLIKYMGNKQLNYLPWIICPFVFAVNSSWLQQGNFTWAFQSQYFLAVILPFALFHFAVTKWLHKPKKIYYVGILILAILSSWTISGGLLVLPVLILVSIINGRHKKELFILCFFVILVSLLYLFDFEFTTEKYQRLSGGFDSFKAVMNFFLTYMSSPLTETFGFSHPVSTVIFILMWTSALSTLYSQTGNRVIPNLPSNVILCQLLFILGLAAVTSMGRFQFGIEQANAAMYKTPSIVGWSIVASVNFISISKKFVKIRVTVPLAVLTILLCSLPSQQRATGDFSQWVNSFKLSAVALKLGVQDKEQLELIHYDYAQLIDYSKPFIRDEFAPFSSIGISRDEFSKRKISLSSIEKICVGNIDSQEGIDSSYLKLSGWISDPQVFDRVLSSSANEIFLLDSKGIVYGFGLQGFIREDVAKVYPLAKYSGFFVYIQRKISDGELFLYSQSYHCKLPISAGVFD